MKNTLIALVIALIAFFLFQHFTAQNDAPIDGVVESAQTAVEKTDTPETLSALISPAAEGAKVFIISPKNGDIVSSPVTVRFGVENMAIAKAGDKQEFSGHHHLLIDLERLPDMTQPLPASEQIIHFGGAQTETTIELMPGSHSLQLLLGNYLHIPHDKPILSEAITITVK